MGSEKNKARNFMFYWSHWSYYYEVRNPDKENIALQKINSNIHHTIKQIGGVLSDIDLIIIPNALRLEALNRKEAISFAQAIFKTSGLECVINEVECMVKDHVR